MGHVKLIGCMVEMKCPKHGLERFKIKVIQKYNIPAETIKPKFRNKPKRSISSLYVGRSVDDKQVKKFLINYFRRKHMLENIVKMQFHR